MDAWAPGYDLAALALRCVNVAGVACALLVALLAADDLA